MSTFCCCLVVGPLATPRLSSSKASSALRSTTSLSQAAGLAEETEDFGGSHGILLGFTGMNHENSGI